MNNDAIYKLLQLNSNASLSTFERLKELKGLDCTVRTPVSRGTIFGKEDLVAYDDMAETSAKLLIFNIFHDASQGGDDYDAFVTDSFVLTKWEDKLPLQTQIFIDFYGRKMSFKVDDHKNLTPTIGKQLFIKNILVPAT